MSQDRLVGLAAVVLYDSDERALRLTLASLERQTIPLEKVVLIVRSGGERPLNLPTHDGRSKLNLHIVPADRHGNLRNRALFSVDQHEFAVMLREGIVLSSTFVERMHERRRAAPAVRASLMVTDLTADINALCRPSLASDDPFRVAAETSLKRGKHYEAMRSRYFAPAVLVFNPRACRGVFFEEFATRSEWAAYRLFIDAVSRNGPPEENSDLFGFIGSHPDRRGGYRQGKDCSSDLYRLAESHPKYRRLAALDRRKLALEQIGMFLFSRAHRKTAFQFLRGMHSQRHQELILRARLQNDISDLS